MTPADYAVSALAAHTERLAIAEIVGGLESLTVMELIHYLDLTADPQLATERETVADWAKVHGLEALKTALVAVNTQEVTV